MNALDIALAISQLVLDWWRLRLTHALWADFYFDFERSPGPTALAGLVVRMVFAQQGIQPPARVCQGVIEVPVLDAVLEAVLVPMFSKPAAEERARRSLFLKPASSSALLCPACHIH